MLQLIIHAITGVVWVCSFFSMQCPKTRWRSCPACQQRIHEQDLEDEYQLQSWFIRRINRFLAAQGKQLIGWDEILEGGLAEGACVMSWRVRTLKPPLPPFPPCLPPFAPLSPSPPASPFLPSSPPACPSPLPPPPTTLPLSCPTACPLPTPFPFLPSLSFTCLMSTVCSIMRHVSCPVSPLLSGISCQAFPSSSFV